MPTFKGILTFPAIFKPKQVRDASGNPTGDHKFSGAILIPPTDPQIAVLQQTVNTAKADTFPSGFPPKGDCCFQPYDTKYAGKDYYDVRFTDWYVLSFTSPESDKPSVVDMAHNPIIDQGSVCSGTVVWVNAGISGYTKGTGGVGGWLNGVMTTGELCEFGRLDNKPTVEQMFANVGAAPTAAGAAAATAIPPAPGGAAPGVPPGPQTPPAAPAQPQYVMTPAAKGFTREQYLKDPAWTDELLISNGLMLAPNGVTPSFS